MRRLSMLGAAVLLAMMTVLVIVPASAQSEITISLAVNTFFEDIFKERVIPAFEAENPGIKVHLVVLDGFGAPMNPNDGVEDYLDDAADFLTKADVVPLDSTILRTITHAGYLLDLSPLADTDPTLNADDFYPAAIPSFRWDGGLWAIPASVDTVQVFYDKAAFDEAGLSYPNGNWTTADYADAIRALTPLDNDGRPSELAVQVFGQASDYFFASFAGDVLDDGVLPNVPDYSNPVLFDVADAWIQLNQENYLTPPSGNAVFTIGGDAEPQALVIGGSQFAAAGPSYIDQIGVAPLPGNQIVMTASGYGVSAGTRYPDAAYALAKFLSSSPDVAALQFQGIPARRDVVASTETFGGGGTAGGGGGAVRFGGPGGPGGLGFSDETQAAIDEGYEIARPASDFAFTDGLQAAMQKVLDGTTTLETALSDVETRILSDLVAADARRSTPIVVDAPPAPVVVANGEIALNFAVSTFTNPLPNAALWEQLAAEFSAQDPQVGAVIVNSEQPFGPGGQADLSTQYECYISSNNPVTGGSVLDTIRSLDPLFQSDTAFDPNDLYGGVLAQLQRDGMTWGVPLALTPEALDYDPEILSAAGIPEPQYGWTVSDFELALRAVKDFTGETPFIPSQLNTTYLSTLIAAYGGIPYDTSTNPATLNFDDPNTVAAIQQVLDLVVNGYMEYQSFTGGRGGFSLSAVQNSAISTTTVGQGGMAGIGRGAIAIISRFGGPDDEEAPVRHFAPFPSGTSLNGAAYAVVAGFVSAQTANVEPCYRWLRFLSQHPELFDGMPVTRSQVADSSLDVAAGSDNAAFYRSFGALLDDPNTLIVEAIPPNFGIPTETYWLVNAFDDYIEAEGDMDLAAALTQAEEYALEFRECAGDNAINLLGQNPLGGGGGEVPGPEQLQARAQALVTCAVSVDPDAAGAFNF